MIEEFFKAHQYTIAAVAAAGTLAAVVTSLGLAWGARLANRTKLKAVANIMLIFSTPIDGREIPKFLQVRITNNGKWPVHIPANFFYWKMPFKREYMTVIPLDQSGHHLIPPKNYPKEVLPRTTEHFHISDLPTFKQEAKRLRGADTTADRLRRRFIRAYVRTDDGTTFRVKLSPEVRQVWSVG